MKKIQIIYLSYSSRLIRTEEVDTDWHQFVVFDLKFIKFIFLKWYHTSVVF